MSVSEHARAFMSSLSSVSEPSPIASFSVPQSPAGLSAMDYAGAKVGSFLDVTTYLYVANNPLRWADSTGKASEATIFSVIVEGACFVSYCAVHATDYCDAKYPPSGGPENDRKRMECASKILWACVTLGMNFSDPIGSAASKVGEEVGKKTCGECSH